MFCEADRNFMINSMKIVVDSIETKLLEPFLAEFKEIVIKSISQYIEAIRSFEASGVVRDLTSSQNNEAEEFIRVHFCDLSEKIDNAEVIQVLDALRYSFSCYAYNGLHQLYTRQENECWHPKIKLTEILYPNDIDLLDQVLTLYRGCDISELETNSFGQAWSTSLEAAKEFAYIHYQSQDWFDVKKRCVLETTYLRENVLFSDQSTDECEVVVDVDKLVCVRIHT